MKLLSFLAILGALAYVAYAYLDGSGQLKRFTGQQKQVEDNKRAAEIAAVKETYWVRSYRAPADCQAPSSSLRGLECKNQADQARANFEKQWTQRLASGWVPPEAKK